MRFTFHFNVQLFNKLSCSSPSLPPSLLSFLLSFLLPSLPFFLPPSPPFSHLPSSILPHPQSKFTTEVVQPFEEQKATYDSLKASASLLSDPSAAQETFSKFEAIANTVER